MFASLKEWTDFIKKNEVEQVDLKFCNLFGGWHHITMPAGHFGAKLMAEGIAFDGSSIPGFKKIESGDMVCIPDLTTGFIDPFWDRPTISFICDLFEADTREPVPFDPRGILRKATQWVKDQGVADHSLWGPEFEFYVFNNIKYGCEVNESFYHIDSVEGFWNSREGCEESSGHWIPQKGGYHAIPPKDQLYNLRSEICGELEAIGIDVHYHHHEVGGPGQMEIEIEMLPPLAAADATMLIKYFTRMVAREHEQVATFMPKPLFGEAGSGMHFHQLLFKGKKPLFYDAKGKYAQFSKLGLEYMAGLLDHADSLLALTNPSTNSFKRLVPGYEAPVNAFFSLGNRSAAIRIPKYATAPDERRMEFRPPDATCNPYLAIAGQYLAGVDGVLKHTDPKRFGPIDENVDLWPEEKKATIHQLPTDLAEALQALRDDNEYLTRSGAFPKDLIERYCKEKYEKEYLPIRNRPHPYEMALYFEC